MQNCNRSRWAAFAAVATAVYFSAALLLRQSYVEAKPDGAITRLTRPFHTDGSNLAFIVEKPELEDLSDSADHPNRSPLWLYEGRQPLGPAHSPHIEIARLGHGRFSHWTGLGFIFSTSDNSNPRSTGRIYWVVRPR